MELGVGGVTRVAPPHRPDCTLEYLLFSGSPDDRLYSAAANSKWMQNKCVILYIFLYYASLFIVI